MKRFTKQGGFTLIELLIVIIIIGILAAIAIPMFLSQRDKAKESAVKEGVHSIQVGIQSYQSSIFFAKRQQGLSIGFPSSHTQCKTVFPL
jgi:type II secretion system protein G